MKPCGGRTGLCEPSPLGVSDVAELQPCASAGLLSLCRGCSSPQISSHVLLTPPVLVKRENLSAFPSLWALQGYFFSKAVCFSSVLMRGDVWVLHRHEHPTAPCSWNSKLAEAFLFGPSRRETWCFCCVCTVTTSLV